MTRIWDNEDYKCVPTNCKMLESGEGSGGYYGPYTTQYPYLKGFSDSAVSPNCEYKKNGSINQSSTYTYSSEECMAFCKMEGANNNTLNYSCKYNGICLEHSHGNDPLFQPNNSWVGCL